jgi:pyruvate/2-oxoacid:ferredoxin oxidoreductase beta subunit
MFPLYEVENGIYTISMKPKEAPLEDYLRLQGRFRHLPEDMVEFVKKHTQEEWERLLKMEEFTKELYGPKE